MEEFSNNILRKVLSSELNDEENQEMLSLFHRDNIKFNVKSELADILDNTKITGDEAKELKPLFEKIWDRISGSEKKKSRRLVPVSSLLKIAASLLLGLIIGSLVFKEKKDTEKYWYTSMAPNGSVSQIILPDSSNIYLNAGSTIKYSMNGRNGERELYLNGEAWFQVERAADKPFIVHTDCYDVVVKGTEFNVRAYDEDPRVVTTLEKGSVEIISGDRKIENSSCLNPGEQLIYNKSDKSFEIKKVVTNWYTSWKENKLIFINMNLRELVTLLERKYGVDIEVTDQRLLKYHYDGTIKNESIIEVLELLKLTLPIDYRINDQKVEIKSRWGSHVKLEN